MNDLKLNKNISTCKHLFDPAFVNLRLEMTNDLSFSPFPGNITGVIGLFQSAVVQLVRADAVDDKTRVVLPINQLLAGERIGEGLPGFGQSLRKPVLLEMIVEHREPRAGDGGLGSSANVIGPGSRVRRRQHPAYEIIAGNPGNHFVRLCIPLRFVLHGEGAGLGIHNLQVHGMVEPQDRLSAENMQSGRHDGCSAFVAIAASYLFDPPDLLKRRHLGSEIKHPFLEDSRN